MKSIASKQTKSFLWTIAKSLITKSKKFTCHSWTNKSKLFYKILNIRVSLVVSRPLTLFVRYHRHLKKVKLLLLKMQYRLAKD